MQKEYTENPVFFLKNDHRFKDDPLFGQFFGRLRIIKHPEDDVREHNKR